MASDKCRLSSTFKTKPVPLFMWLLLTQRGAVGGAPELSGGGKPHPTWCHSLGPVSCLCGQERLGTCRAQPSSPSGIPHSFLSKTMGRTCTWDMGSNRQPHRGNTRCSQGFIHLKWSTGQFLISHSTLEGSSCSSALHTSMALKFCRRCHSRQAAPVQVHSAGALQWCWDMPRTRVRPYKHPWLMNNPTKHHRGTLGCGGGKMRKLSME